MARKHTPIDWTTDALQHQVPLPNWVVVEIETARTDAEGRIRIFGMSPSPGHSLCLERCEAGAVAIVEDILDDAPTVMLRHGWMLEADFGAAPEFTGW